MEVDLSMWAEDVAHFRSAPEPAAWLLSPEPAVLLAEADQHCDGDLALQQASGVAGWFTLPGTELVKPPSKVKMAITTWLGSVPLLLPLNLYCSSRSS